MRPEVAEYLASVPSTIYRLLKKYQIPGSLGSDWRFRRTDVENWIAAQHFSPETERIPAGRKGRKRKA